MSDTPRTFWAIEEYRRYGGSPQNEPVFSSDMSDLENKLNATTAKCNILINELADMTKQRDALSNALAEVRVWGYRSTKERLSVFINKALAATKGESHATLQG